MISRRAFLASLLAAPVAAVKIQQIQLGIPVSLYGIPYHCTDASTGTWLGFSRIVTISNPMDTVRSSWIKKAFIDE